MPLCVKRKQYFRNNTDLIAVLVHTCLHQSMYSSSRNPLSEHLLSLAMAELHNERSPPTKRRLYDSYQAAVTMRGELDDLYACISGLRPSHQAAVTMRVENAVCQQDERPQLLLGRRLVDASPPVDFFREIDRKVILTCCLSELPQKTGTVTSFEY